MALSKAARFPCSSSLIETVACTTRGERTVDGEARLLGESICRRAMSSVPVSDEGSFLAGTVELVPSLRGKDKAKYLDRTFTLESCSGHRYRWRCDQRQCKSRLITDFYGGEHMVYKFRDHDEDTHRLVESKRKRRLEITYKQKPVKIGDFQYVSEKRIGGLIFWRCVYVSCPGRCRTHDGHLVSGPSEHLCPAPAKKVQPYIDDQCNNISGGVAHTSDDCTVLDCRDDTEGSSRDVVSHEQQEEGLGQPLRKRLKQQLEKDDQGRQLEQKQQPDNRSSSPATNSEPVALSKMAFNLKSLIKSEPPSPVAPKDTSADGISNVDALTAKAMHSSRSETPEDRSMGAIFKPAIIRGTSLNKAFTLGINYVRFSEDNGDVIEDDRSTVSNASSDDEIRNVDEDDPKESRECRGYVGSNNGDEEPTRVSAGDAEKGEPRGRISVNEGHDERPRKMADRFVRVGSNRTRAGHRERIADWMQATGGYCSSREKELREDMLLQMCRRLEAETELLKEMRRTEVLREKLLARRCEALGVETVPVGADCRTGRRRRMSFEESKE
ncbi:uncharacterized protein LOC119460688 [Dermacentor silvarum]|uniref:uncharacterized protein LOC119460688 n=1 Tax=Dermacentor silvarum TaxID=543639 RepID=UPI001899A78D|nr:uncharacterized protein LOC119460688 [Dermacentor silvarum]